MTDDPPLVEMTTDQHECAQLVYRALREQLGIVSLARGGLPQVSVVVGLTMAVAFILAEYIDEESHAQLIPAIGEDIAMRTRRLVVERAARDEMLSTVAAAVMPVVGRA